jgi:hypothetical protein
MNYVLVMALMAQVLVAAALPAELPPGGAAPANRHWAYRLPEAVSLPRIRDAFWPEGVVDAFILARLEAAGLRPAADAEAPLRLRRIYFDLHGLPPTPAEIEQFLFDREPNAFARLVDRLLASPRFGERWGRHWLDVVRYAESLTLRGLILPQAWRFRDYVIASFNADRPFDQFVRQHVAGDLLDAQSLSERQEQLIATTFLTLGNHNLEHQDKQQLRMDVVDEQLEAIGRAFLAQTIGCARCHDHKFDPIPTRDYYALAGILRNTRTLEDANVSKWLELPLPVPPEEECRYRAHELALAKVDAELKAVKESSAQGNGEPGSRDVLRQALETERRKLLDTGPSRPMVMAVLEESAIADSPVFRRGDVHSPGEVVARGFLAVATYGPRPVLPPDASGRRELAQWLASPENPLTARVMVNRAWHWLFGAGLVRTVDNFGTTGEAPSHPELLDWLALRFVRDDWSVKRLVRRLVLSRTYGLTSSGADDPSTMTADPANRLHGRSDRRRLDAECMRDAMLVAADELDLSMGGPTIRAAAETDYGYEHDQRSRSVYLPVLRNSLPEVLELFDFANPSVCTGRRSVSTVAPQALLMMNHPWVLDCARRAASALMRDSAANDDARILLAFLRTYGRPPTPRERNLSLDYVVRVRSSLVDGGDLEAYSRMMHALFGSVGFRYLE